MQGVACIAYTFTALQQMSSVPGGKVLSENCCEVSLKLRPPRTSCGTAIHFLESRWSDQQRHVLEYSCGTNPWGRSSEDNRNLQKPRTMLRYGMMLKDATGITLRDTKTIERIGYQTDLATIYCRVG